MIRSVRRTLTKRVKTRVSERGEIKFKKSLGTLFHLQGAKQARGII